MPKRTAVDPAEVRALLTQLHPWVQSSDTAAQPGSEFSVSAPARTQVARAVRESARWLETAAPGHSVELRVPPFVAVQCIEGPRHTRGTPPNVVEMAPTTWLRLVTGVSTWEHELSTGALEVSGTRAGEIAHWLPLFHIEKEAE